MAIDLAANADRFSGFADLYDAVRPVPPADLARILCGYAATTTPAVVDLGSGSGLSSRWAATWAASVIGVEPSADMRRTAQAAGGGPRYVEGWSHATGLPAAHADLVLAVQALHWMEPAATFAEVARLLRPGGVFAAIDCDFPPIVGSRTAEQAWTRCRARIVGYERRVANGDDLSAPLDAAPLPAGFASDAPRTRREGSQMQAWSKGEHLARMEQSGRFTWCHELVTASVIDGDATRFVALLRSQGDYQTIRMAGVSDAQIGFDRFEADVHAALGAGGWPMSFSYRVRIAIV